MATTWVGDMIRFVVCSAVRLLQGIRRFGVAIELAIDSSLVRIEQDEIQILSPSNHIWLHANLLKHSHRPILLPSAQFGLRLHPDNTQHSGSIDRRVRGPRPRFTSRDHDDPRIRREDIVRRSGCDVQMLAELLVGGEDG